MEERKTNKKNKEADKYSIYYPKWLNLYNNGVSATKIAKEYGIHVTTVTRGIKRIGGIIKPATETHRKYHLNENVFELIDTEEKAYWLGFLYADGSVGIEKYSKTIKLELKEDDYQHLVKFINFLQADYPIRKSRSKINNKFYYHFGVRISSPKLVDDLIKYGCVPNKTYLLKDLPDIDNTLMRHFIRGYFDGDGSISINNNKYEWTIVGKKEFLVNFQNILVKQTGVNYTKLKCHKKSDVVYLRYSGNQVVKKICEWLYNDATIFLDRKYKRIIDYGILSGNQRGVG
jgi:DNA-binding transcriptional regulator WhiA